MKWDLKIKQSQEGLAEWNQQVMAGGIEMGRVIGTLKVFGPEFRIVYLNDSHGSHIEHRNATFLTTDVWKFNFPIWWPGMLSF